MDRTEFIGKLQMVYVGDRNAFNEIVGVYDELKQENQRLNDDIKVLLKENEAKEKVIIKQDNILNALEESYIEDIEKLESFGIERQVEIAEIISCYKFYLRRLRELKESDK